MFILFWEKSCKPKSGTPQTALGVGKPAHPIPGTPQTALTPHAWESDKSTWDPIDILLYRLSTWLSHKSEYTRKLLPKPAGNAQWGSGAIMQKQTRGTALKNHRHSQACALSHRDRVKSRVLYGSHYRSPRAVYGLQPLTSQMGKESQDSPDSPTHRCTDAVSSNVAIAPLPFLP